MQQHSERGWSAEGAVEEVFALYEAYGSEDYIGEPVSQVEHMVQSGELARAEGHDEEVILAAFFHDIGHLCSFILPLQEMQGLGVMDHETVGERFLLDRGFSPRIGRLVRSHVEAKRYLTFRHPDYLEKLSEASRATLDMQGGPMTAEEAAAFETDPDFPLFIRLREWDDLAKQADLPPPDIAPFRDLALAHLKRRSV